MTKDKIIFLLAPRTPQLIDLRAGIYSTNERQIYPFACGLKKDSLEVIEAEWPSDSWAVPPARDFAEVKIQSLIAENPESLSGPAWVGILENGRLNSPTAEHAAELFGSVFFRIRSLPVLGNSIAEDADEIIKKFMASEELDLANVIQTTTNNVLTCVRLQMEISCLAEIAAGIMAFNSTPDVEVSPHE